MLALPAVDIARAVIRQSPGGRCRGVRGPHRGVWGVRGVWALQRTITILDTHRGPEQHNCYQIYRGIYLSVD